MSCIFCDFISSERAEHRNGLPFMPIHEMENTVSFLSIDFPEPEDGHTLVIPKDHYAELEDVPQEILGEMMAHAQEVSEALREEHGGVNLLLNNGREADQSVKHVHLHVIPGEEDDGISIENYESKDLDEGEFRELTEKLKDRIE